MPGGTDSRDGGGAVATLEPVRIGADGHSDPFATEALVTAEGAVGDMGRGARVGRRSTATSNGT